MVNIREEKHMKLGIMQPYFFPYIGYWQLMNCVDKYIVYDDVNFIKGGWINRNRILLNGKEHLFNVPMIGASSNKLINQVKVDNNKVLRNKLIKKIEHAYSDAPLYNEIIPVLTDILFYEADDLGAYLFYSIVKIARYLDMDTDIVLSSKLKKNDELKGQDKVISICKIVGADEYYNAIGGLELYDFAKFKENGIQLFFLKTGNIMYLQGKNEFVENLSIIDVLMYNTKNEVKNFLNLYELVTETNR